MLARTAERSLARPELRIVVPASAALEPVSPNAPLLIAFGALALGLAGVMLALRSEHWRLVPLRIDV